MQLRYKSIKWKLFINYFLLFFVFLLSILIYQNLHEKQFKISLLENRLNGYTDLIDKYIIEEKLVNPDQLSRLDSLKTLIPPSQTRITILDRKGDVLYDNFVANYRTLENHSHRPEFQKAIKSGSGFNVRHSTTTDVEYFYYAKVYNNLIIRSAVEYNFELQNYLNIDRAFMLFCLFLFIIFGAVLRLITKRMGDSVAKLKDFALRVRTGHEMDEDLKFSNDEIGIISNEISSLFEHSRMAKADLL
jgi:two-component system, OmpR family, phosphate regulon sensor histidine kinase PhoR